jgi:hypothetical protein
MYRILILICFFALTFSAFAADPKTPAAAPASADKPRLDKDKWTTPHLNPNGAKNKYPYAISDLPREGFIGLQDYQGTPVWFRNIRIKPLSDRQPKYTGYEPIQDVLAKHETASGK